MTRGMLILIGVLGAGTVALLLLIFADVAPPPLPQPPAPPAKPSPRPARPTPGEFLPLEAPPVRPARPSTLEAAPAPFDGGTTPATVETGVAGYPASGLYGVQADEDRRKLGPAAYTDMERLWARGKKGRGDPDAQAALKELLDKFPDSHRAGCAAYELGVHQLKDARLSMRDRVNTAESSLMLAREKYGDSRCDGDVPARNAAGMALATEVFRHKDPRRATTILRELSELPPTELDSRGRPVAERARVLLQNIKEGAPPPLDESTPVQVPGRDGG